MRPAGMTIYQRSGLPGTRPTITAPGQGAGCRRKPNGNTQPEWETARRGTATWTRSPGTQTIAAPGESTATPSGRLIGRTTPSGCWKMATGRTGWGRRNPTPGTCTTWWETSGNGWKTGMPSDTTNRVRGRTHVGRSPGRPERYGADRGTAVRVGPVYPAGTGGSRQMAVTVLSGSAAPRDQHRRGQTRFKGGRSLSCRFRNRWPSIRGSRSGVGRHRSAGLASGPRP